jgi:hypothetical protein
MSVRKTTCYRVVCDTCREGFDDTDGEVHFDSADYAIAYVADRGWLLTDDGHIECPRCAVTAVCIKHGHIWGAWIPCHCKGSVPGHHIHGCGLFRICRRPHCHQHDDSTFADLPTIDEPRVPGC